jgi:hypothetical protein
MVFLRFSDPGAVTALPANVPRRQLATTLSMQASSFFPFAMPEMASALRPVLGP